MLPPLKGCKNPRGGPIRLRIEICNDPMTVPLENGELSCEQRGSTRGKARLWNRCFNSDIWLNVEHAIAYFKLQDVVGA